ATANQMLIGRNSVGQVRVLDAASGALRMDPIVISRMCYVARYSPDGSRMVIASDLDIDTDGGDVRVWDAATGRPLSPPMHHAVLARDAFFTRDGGRVVTVGDALRIWDASSGEPVGTPMRFSHLIQRASLCPDGRHVLVVCGGDTSFRDPGFAQVLDLAT